MAYTVLYPTIEHHSQKKEEKEKKKKKEKKQAFIFKRNMQYRYAAR